MSKFNIKSNLTIDIMKANGVFITKKFHNDVVTAFKNTMIDGMLDADSTDFALNNLMDSGDEGSELTGTIDGIAMQESDGSWYMLDCSAVSGYGLTDNGNSLSLVGWTDKVGEYGALTMGHNVNSTTTTNWANKVLKQDIEVTTGDSVTITWNIILTNDV